MSDDDGLAEPPAQLRVIGVIRSALKARADAPMQGHEGAPDAWLEVHPWAAMKSS